MKIGELARITGTSVETIRYYEREGLIPETSRNASNYRIYESVHAKRLSFIRNCRNLDMTLEEIRALLRFKDVPSENCADVSMVLDEHIGHVVTRIAELLILKKQLENLRAKCKVEGNTTVCGILCALSQNMPAVNRQTILPTDHVHGTHGGSKCNCGN